MTQEVDLFVIGGGSGGVRAARIAATHGAKVAIAEEHRYGGTCVIRGCIPKKLFVYAADFSHIAEDGASYGWNFPSPTFDWKTLLKNKDEEIERLSDLYKQNLARHDVTILDGRARITAPHTVTVGNETYKARYILIATGGTPVMPAIPGVEHAISSNEAFHLEELPKRVTVVGGGYIGVEFAGIFAGLGSEVTFVHRGELVLRGFDIDIRKSVTEGLANEGIKCLLNTNIVWIRKDDGLTVATDDGANHEADQIMFATGRRPMTDDLGLEALGVKQSENGAVVVDERSQSSVDYIYAVGDCTDHVTLTPVAIREGHAFADSVFGGTPRTLDYSNIPTAVFSRPPTATVGLTEEQAGTNIDVYESRFRPLFHTLTGREERIMMKLIVDRASDKVLGVHMVGKDAPEIIQAVGIAVASGLTKAQFDNCTALHPSTAEELVLMRTKRP